MRTATIVVTASILGLANGVVRSQSHAAQPDSAGYIPEISIAEIMESMVMPTAQVVWDAVSVSVGEQGTVETKPETDEAWAELRAAAVTLAEAADTLVIPGRHAAPAGTVSDDASVELTPEKIEALLAQQQPAWDAHAHVLHAAAMEALHAISTRSPKRVGRSTPLARAATCSSGIPSKNRRACFRARRPSHRR